MYELYKKVFNNKYLKSKIYNYVKFKDDIENNKDLKQCYINLNQYYNVQDLDIIQLIKRKEFNLLFKMIDNYFEYAIKDPIKYWYYIIQPSKQEMNELLKLIDLGFHRFKLLYNEFKTVFNQQKQVRILKSVIISGNIEIFNYLTKECGYQFDKGFEIQIYNLNCGGNFELFKMLIENHYTDYSNLNKISNTIIRKISSKLEYYHYKSGIKIYKDCWNTDYSWNSDKYFKIYKYLLKQPITPPSSSDSSNVNYLFSTCFINQDLSLAKALVHYVNKYNTATPKLDNKLNIILHINNIEKINFKLFFTNESIKILNFLIENLNENSGGSGDQIYKNFNDMFIKLEKPLFKELIPIIPYRINIEMINDNDRLISKLLEVGYLPNSIEEFNYIISKQELLDKFNVQHDSKLSDLLIHTSSIMVNLEYFKLVYKYFLPRSRNVLDTVFMNCLDTTFEIYKFIIKIYEKEGRDDKELLPIKALTGYNSCCSNYFNGDIKTMDHFFKLVNYPLDFIFQKLKYLTFNENSTRIKSFKFLISILINLNNQNKIKINKHDDLLIQVLQATYSNENYELFQYLLDNIYTERQDRLNLYKLLDLDQPYVVLPLYQSLIRISISNQDNNINFRNQLINSIFINNQYLISSSSLLSSLSIIKSNSTKVLDVILENSQISNYFPNSSRYFISNLIGTNLKKLIYLLNLDNQINQSNYLIKNFKLLIQESINSNNLIIIKYLISNSSGDGSGSSGDLLINDNFKIEFYSYLLFYSILSYKFKRNRNYYLIGESLLIGESSCIGNILSNDNNFKYYDINLLLTSYIKNVSISNFKLKLISFLTSTTSNKLHHVLLKIKCELENMTSPPS